MNKEARISSSRNIEWVNSLRVFATFSVVFLHVTGPILSQYGSISNFDWWIGNIYDSAVRFCVPMFLMISGTLILSKTYDSTGEYLKKRVVRILLPFLFWSIIYIGREVFLILKDGGNMTTVEILQFGLLRLKTGASFHFWYVYLIIGLYLFFPILGKWASTSTRREIRYFLLIWLITVFANLMFVRKYIPNIDLTYFNGYIGLPVLGYYLSKTSYNFKGKNVVYLLLILIGALITMLGTYYMTKRVGVFWEGFYGYLTPNVILVTIGLFLFFKDSIRYGERTSAIIRFFSKYSYGIYLVHILVLWELNKHGLSYAFVHPIIGIPIFSVLCFTLSTLIVFVINKLPLGKYISG